MVNRIVIAFLFLWGCLGADNSEDFWSPIDVVFGSSSNDPTIVLCKLNFRAYSASPHSYSKFKDLVKISGCISHSKREKLSKLMAEKALDRIPPTGTFRPFAPSWNIFSQHLGFHNSFHLSRVSCWFHVSCKRPRKLRNCNGLQRAIAYFQSVDALSLLH